MRQFVHLINEHPLLFSKLCDSLLVAKVAPSTERSLLVMLVNPIDERLHVLFRRLVLPTEQFNGIVNPLLLLEVESDLHIAQPVLIAITLIG